MAVALATLTVLLCFALQRSHRHEGTGSAAGPRDVAAVSESPSRPADSPSNDEVQKPGGPYVSSDPRWAITRQKDKSDHNWEWRMPIDFYGRVVDENDQPIAGASIEFSWTDLSPAGNSTARTSSDSSGAFFLRGKSGRHLQVDISKEGFYKPVSERLKSFDFAAFWEANYYEPDAAQPVTFHLRKRGAGATLSSGEVQASVGADGAPVRLDLLSSARISPAGQLEIAAVTNTEKYPPARFDWRASITVPDGGLIEHNLEFPFEAPNEGYQPTVEFQMPANALDWKRVVEKDYFIRFGTPPKFGRIHIRFNGAAQRVSVRYAVNPSGSRNLEANADEQH